MDGNKNFLKYKQNKKHLKKRYKGYYQIEKILALDLASKIYFPNKNRLFSIFRIFFTYSFKDLNGFSGVNTLFSIGDYNRKDYYEILNYVKSNVHSHYVLDFSQRDYKFSFNLSNTITAFYNVLLKTDIPLKSRFLLAAKVNFYLNVICSLEKVDVNFDKYCAFSSVHPLEAILSYYFQKRHIPTYSLQHGLYFIFEKNILFDSILYENFLSDYHFCWGQYSADELKKYGISENSLLVGGYPRKVERKKIPQTLNKAECILLLARKEFDETNMELLKILETFSKENNINITLKLHPSLSLDKYTAVAKANKWKIIDMNITLKEIFSSTEYGWSIAINTAAYYEAYLHYIPCLRYNDQSFEDSLGVFADTFYTYGELNQKLEHIPFTNQLKLKEYFIESDRRLEYLIGFNVNNYHKLNQ